MPRLILLLALLLSGGGLMSQTKSFPVKGNQTLNLAFDQAQITIIGTSASNVEIETSDYEAPPARAKGLKPLYNNATDNTGIGLMLEEGNGEMTIRQAQSKSGEYVLRVPKGMNLKFQERAWMGRSDLTIRNMSGEIEIETKNSDIILQGITGPVTAGTTSGDIEIIFSSLSQKGPTTLTNISGYIDVTMPGNTKANLLLKNITGEIYSNLELATKEKDGLQQVGGQRNVEAMLNNGGVELMVKNISGDIFLRKQ